MADVHVLAGSGGHLQMVCHIPIPNANNSASVNWRTAVVNAGLNTTMLPDGDGTNGTISAAEKAQVVAGELYESIVEILPDTAPNATARLAYVDAVYNATVTSEQNRLQEHLKWFGFTRDVP